MGHHPNILSYQKEDDNTISMVYEVCDHELTEQLTATPVVSEAAVAQLCKPMLLALDHCHSNGKCCQAQAMREWELSRQLTEQQSAVVIGLKELQA